MRLLTEARRTRRSWAVLVVLVGVFSGVVIGVAAGARRTATAFPRMAAQTRSSDAFVAAFNTGLGGYYDKLARRPDVEGLARIAGLPLFPATPSGEPVFIKGNVLAPIDGRYGYEVNRPIVLAGRLPQRDRVDEVFINEVTARRFHVDVGDRLPMVAFHEGAPEPEPAFPVTITGIGRFVEEIVHTTKFDAQESLLMSPAAYRRWGAREHLHWDGALVRMREPARLAAFRSAAEREAAADAKQTSGEILFADHIERNRLVGRTIAPQALALTLFAAFAAFAGFFVLGQALSRQLAERGADAPILRALGFTRRQVFGLTLMRAGAFATASAVVASVVAVLLSPLFPVGAARRAELHEGLDVNIAFLAVGALVMILLLLMRAVSPAARLARIPAGLQTTNLAESEQPSRLTTRLAAAGLGPSALTGVRMAVESGGGRGAVPVRATLAGAITALAAVAAAVTFAANLDRLVTTPGLYGRTWDVTFDGSFGPLVLDSVRPVLDTSEAVAAWSGGFYAEATVEDRAVTAIGTNGPVRPPIVEGREPQRDHEIVLGTRTLRAAHRRVGERVDVVLGGERKTMTVVGRAVFPALGRGSFPQTGLGDGALLTATATAPPPDPEMTAELGGRAFYNFFLVELTPGASPAETAELGRRLMPLCAESQDCRVVSRPADERPAQITNLDRIRWTPTVLAGVLAVLGVAAVAHSLVSSIRQRRRDLAVLKTIGFLRSQVSAAVAWQATTIAAAAVLVGLPMGLALGRVLWRALAQEVGIVPDVMTPGVALLVAAPAAVLVVNLIALVPGWLAGRVQPATVLRSE